MKMPNMNQMMKQVQDAMQQAEQMETALAAEHFDVSTGGGMVKAEFNGIGNMLSIKINPEVIKENDAEMLEDLVLAAVKEGQMKATAIRDEKVKALTGGMPNIPGLNLPF